MTSSSVLRQGALHAIFQYGFWKSDHDFLIGFQSTFLSRTHGFWDNEVLLPTGFDVIVISPLGGVLHRFCWRIRNNDPSFIIMVYWHISRISYHFEVVRHFIMPCNCPFRPNLGLSFGLNTPKFHNYTFLILRRIFLTLDHVIWAVVCEHWFTGSSVEELKNKTATGPVYFAPIWRLNRSSNPNQLWQGCWPF